MAIIGRIVVFVVGFVLVAGCGGGVSPKVDKTTSPPAPKSYSTKQVQDALPGVEEIPGAKTLSYRCPGEKGACSESEGDETFSLLVKLAPPGSGVQAERAAKNEVFGDIAYVAGTLHASSTSAMTALAQIRKTLAKYDGDYEFKAESTGGKSYAPGEKGVGSLGDVTVDGWSGFQLARAGVTTSPSNDSEKRQEADLSVVRGVVELTVHVGLASDGRSLGDAKKLARRLAEDYLARLG